MRAVTFLLLLILFEMIAAPAQTEQVGGWSQPVDGLRGRLSAKEDKPFHGTRIIAVYLELENVSDVGNPMEIYFDPTRSVESNVVDASGKDLSQPPNGADVITPQAFWLALPNDGSLRFRVSVSGYGVYENSGTNVQMNSGNWVIKPSDKGKYFLKAKFVSQPPKTDRRRSWHGSLDLPDLLIPH